MSEKMGNANRGEALESQVYVANPTRLRLSSIRECRRELAKVYIEARNGNIQPQNATRLTYILVAITNMIKDSDLEERIKKLEDQSNFNL